MQASKQKIWIQLLSTIGAALLVVWTGVIIWQGHVTRQAALEQATDFSASMHDATMAGLTGMMVTGTIPQREILLDQIKQLGSIRDVRVLRGEAVIKLFGPGNANDDHTPDAIEQLEAVLEDPTVQTGHLLLFFCSVLIASFCWQCFCLKFILQPARLVFLAVLVVYLLINSLI